jgi:membrane protein YdbS with pleckstrin-like domain
MSKRTDELTQWIYSGVWGIITEWFRVPAEPPALPAAPNERVESFRPAPGYLRYLKFQFWIGLLAIDIAILVGWVVLLVAVPVIGLLTAPLAFAVAVLPDIVAYVALHLRYDTTWYVLSPRSVRIRRGIWTIQEMTFTFENVQNVKVSQGPLQRYFGIADVVIETAGGGGGAQQQQGHAAASMHLGRIEGIENARDIRDLILQHMRKSKAAGLGDESPPTPTARAGWRPEHLAVLREIRDLIRS